MTHPLDKSGTVRVADGPSHEEGGGGVSSSAALQLVEFHGDAVWAGEVDGRILVAVKALCGNLGLDWSAQFRRIKRDEILSEGVVVMATPTPSGQQETICLPLQLLPGFLFGVSADRISNPAARARVIDYKRECHGVLYRHFFERRYDVDPTSLPLMEKARLLREIRLAGGRQAAASWLERLGLGLPPGGRPEVTSSEIDREAAERVRLFLANCTRAAMGARVQASDMFSACNAFLAASGRPRLNNVRFGRAMAACGVAKERGSRYYYLGREVITPHPLGP